MVDRIRIGALQYYVRPVQSFDDFVAQVTALVETARDYKINFLVFPEYFTTQLLTLGDVRRPIAEQIRDLAHQEMRMINLFSTLSKTYKLFIIGGTVPSLQDDANHIKNACHIFSPKGLYETQYKLHMTRFENEEWLVHPGDKLKIFETSLGTFAVAICYDVEFPEIARTAARQGAEFLVVPSCTDDKQGYLRVRYCAQARAIENQMYVVHSPLVGSLPSVPAVSLNFGQAAIYTPSDYSFPRDGLMAEGIANQESMVIGDLQLNLIRESRKHGTVLPLRDSISSEEMLKRTGRVVLEDL